MEWCLDLNDFIVIFLNAVKHLTLKIKQPSIIPSQI